MRKLNLAFAAAGALAAVSFLGAARADDEPEVSVGPIEDLGDVQATAQMLFKAADLNNDGYISRQEAVDAGNLVAGGFFFKADANGDGKVTKEEADQAREHVFNQRPILRFLFDRTKQETSAQGGADAVQQARQDVMAFIDTNKDGSIDAAELRQAVNTGVQTLFLTGDANNDGQLSTHELNGAAVEFGKAGLQAAFQNVDLDKNGALSREEFEKAVMDPANVAFRVMDANNDGQLSGQELIRGMKVIAGELQNLQVAEPAQTLPDRVINAINAAPAGTAAPAAAPATTVAPAATPAPVVVQPR